MKSIIPYIKIARVDHWFKNSFMVLGAFVAYLYEPDLLSVEAVPRLLVAILATCLVASANYVLNEILDAPTDRLHPVKRHRPVASGQVRLRLAYAEWLLLGLAGVALGSLVNPPFLFALLGLFGMALVYNVRPIRAKEVAFTDVVVESVNHPIRLMLGWFALIPDLMPPLSLLIAYWALGAFFMATKRLAELRAIGDRATAAAYRRSFASYTEESLMISMLFHIAACSFFGGVFIVRCKLELILCVPLIAGVFAYYLALGLKPDSPVQNPERLYRERGFVLFTLLTLLVFTFLMFAHIPVLYDWFAFDEPKTPRLWTF